MGLREVESIEQIDIKLPAILLVNPKFPHNVGGVQRAAACFGVDQVLFTGNRIPMNGSKGDRLPREERLRAFKGVDVVNVRSQPWTVLRDVIKLRSKWTEAIVPVAVDLVPGTESLYYFEHPTNALYVFGPEDGTLGGSWLSICHKFVSIPTTTCLNLAAAVNVVLYDMKAKTEWPRL